MRTILDKMRTLLDKIRTLLDKIRTLLDKIRCSVQPLLQAIVQPRATATFPML